MKTKRAGVKHYKAVLTPKAKKPRAKQSQAVKEKIVESASVSLELSRLEQLEASRTDCAVALQDVARLTRALNVSEAKLRELKATLVGSLTSDEVKAALILGCDPVVYALEVLAMRQPRCKWGPIFGEVYESPPSLTAAQMDAAKVSFPHLEPQQAFEQYTCNLKGLKAEGKLWRISQLGEVKEAPPESGPFTLRVMTHEKLEEALAEGERLTKQHDELFFEQTNKGELSNE